MLGYFDCFSGASGDMILGALVDAGWSGLEEALTALNVPGWRLSVRQVTKRGIGATKVDFDIDEGATERHLSDMLTLLESSRLDPAVRTSAEAIFRRLATVEAAIHGQSVEEVHFHELGGLDTLLDVVGACAGLAHFGFQTLAVSPIAVGSGTVKTRHGLLPVPAPATAKLLEGWAITPGHVEKELTTPTGAAILTHFATSQGMPAMRIQRVAYGAGTRELDSPNVVRLLVGNPVGSQPTETIVVVEAMVDDMSPEQLPAAVERIMAAGALDAYVTPVLGKKGRPAYLLTTLAVPGADDAVMDAILRHTSTIGLRFHSEQRRTLPRHEQTVHTEYGPVRVKVSGAGPLRKAKPEFDDCQRLALERDVPVSAVYQSALAGL
ncbi:MAG TPA: nickel pincer cofactor biosynthesis protein LarC [Chloroflexota bacterium]|nr:nickel pincer cofactor biosynthesis protein LarC [Chloroflexota bacterium]